MTSTINRQITTNNLENLNHRSQSMKGTMMKKARKYTMSLAFAATVLTGLLTGAGTAQAGTAQANQCQHTSQTTMYCQDGYTYEYHQSTGSWSALNRTTGVRYILTNGVWLTLDGAVGYLKGLVDSLP